MSDLVVQNLQKQYETGVEPLTVLRDVSLTASFGESLAIIGPSGCGKSTLLNLIGLLDRPTSGSIRLEDLELSQLADHCVPEWRATTVGFIFQSHQLLPQLTALENVLLPVLATEKRADSFVARADELLTRVGLADRRDHLPGQMSGGERQRVAIARAMIRRPRLVLADEPTGNLDRTNATVVGSMLLETAKHQSPKTLSIIVTHSMSLAARCDRVFELDNGALLHVDNISTNRAT